MRQLDPKLLKILALWSSTDIDGERQSARARGEALAKKCGMSFEEAVGVMRSEHRSASRNPFEGFADWQEVQTPGYKAQCARERAERLRQDDERRAALIALHGSLEAVLEPCPSEILLQAAVAPW